MVGDTNHNGGGRRRMRPYWTEGEGTRGGTPDLVSVGVARGGWT